MFVCRCDERRRPKDEQLEEIFSLLQRIKRKLVGEEVKGVGVMKDEVLKLEEIEDSLTLGT